MRPRHRAVRQFASAAPSRKGSTPRSLTLRRGEMTHDLSGEQDRICPQDGCWALGQEICPSDRLEF
jgi:hypothetical protein